MKANGLQVWLQLLVVYRNFSDNTSYTITNGKDGAAGADAVKWEIGTDGFGIRMM